MEIIDVALAADANYFPGLLVTACSLARHASREVSLRFNILDGGLGESNRAFLESRLTEMSPSVSIRYFDVDQRTFSAFPEWGGESRMTYARLLAAELIDDAEFCIYSDVDILWMADVSELWGLRDSRCCVQGCMDLFPDGIEKRRRWYDDRNIPVDMGRHVCAGMLIMNLRRFRKDRMPEKIMDFLRCYKDPPFVDQTAINAVVSEIGILPRAWMRFSYEIKANGFAEAKAIHFAGDAPWKKYWWSQTLAPSWRLWHEFYGSLYGISAWQSLRRVYSVREIVIRKAVYLVISGAVSRALFFVLLRLTGRGCYIASLKEKVGCHVD